MSTRASYELMTIGRNAKQIGDRFGQAEELLTNLREARETLMRCSAAFQAIICDFERLPISDRITTRFWDVWQRTEVAVKYADDAVMLLNADSAETVVLATEHKVIPFLGAFPVDQASPKAS